MLSVPLQEMLVAAGDTGRDYEHCLELQKKLNDVEGVSMYSNSFFCRVSLVLLVSHFLKF